MALKLFGPQHVVNVDAAAAAAIRLLSQLSRFIPTRTSQWDKHTSF